LVLFENRLVNHKSGPVILLFVVWSRGKIWHQIRRK